MRCIACGAEMRLMQAVPDETMMVPGYEHQTWQCTGCDDVERRLMFTGGKTPIVNVPVPTAQSPDKPAPAPGVVSSSAASAWARAMARFRGEHTD